MRLSIPKVHGATQKERIIRTLALILVFAAVIWAFSKNNERVVDRLNQEGVIYDETKTLSKEQIKIILSFTASLRSQFGLNSKIQIYGGDFVVPDLDAKTLYIGLAPPIDQVEIRFPGLMRKAVGKKFIDSLKNDHFLPSFKYDDWPEELQVVLVAISDRLTLIAKGTPPSDQ